jgi:hypothetical protein
MTQTTQIRSGKAQPVKTRKQLKKESYDKPQAQVEAKPVSTLPAMTKELGLAFRQLQPAKVRLTKHLQKIEGSNVIVQLELRDNRWVFLVRGANPKYTVWEETPCFYIPSILISNQQ